MGFENTGNFESKPSNNSNNSTIAGDVPAQNSQNQEFQRFDQIPAPNLASPKQSNHARIYLLATVIIIIAIGIIYIVIGTHFLQPAGTTITTATTTQQSTTTTGTTSTSTTIPVVINYTNVPNLQDFVSQQIINATPTGRNMVLLYNYSFTPPGTHNTSGYSQQYTLPAFSKIMSNNFTDIGYNETIPSQYVNSSYPLSIALFIYKFNNDSSAQEYYATYSGQIISTNTLHIANTTVSITHSTMGFGAGLIGKEMPLYRTMQDSFATFIYKNYVGYISVYGTLNDYNSSYTYDMAEQMYGRLAGSNVTV